MGIALIGVMVAGCGGSSPSAAPTTTSAVPAVVSPSANTVGLCGGVTDAEVAQDTGLTGLRRIAVNPMSCAWQPAAGGDYAVVFQWFRGSPLQARRTEVTTGTPATVRVAGDAGIEWHTDNSCEVAVAFGDTDFVDWSLTAAADSARPQPCKALEQLATSTLTKAGQG